MTWNVHDEDMADAPSRAQSGLPLHHFGQQLVGVQAPLHEKICFACTHQLDGFLGCGLAVRHIDDLNAAEV
jgi:hypothetical protein